MAISKAQIDQFIIAKNQEIPHYTNFYGMRFLLEDLLGFSIGSALNIHLDHGIIIRMDKPDQYLERTDAGLIFVDNTARKQMVPNKKNVFVLGPLFMRFRRKHRFTYNASAKGTIVFPTHSSHHLSLVMDWEKYAKQLVSLPSRFQPVTVCMYWLDVLNGDHRYFEDAGLKVICNGHMFDNRYAFNFYRNLVQHKYALGNEPGSFTFYAAEMGMPFYIMGPDATLINDGLDHTAPARTTFNDITLAKDIKRVFSLNLDQGAVPESLTKEKSFIMNIYFNDKDWLPTNTLRFLILKELWVGRLRWVSKQFGRVKRRGRKIMSDIMVLKNN